jgi:hypothetical protein
MGGYNFKVVWNPKWAKLKGVFYREAIAFFSRAGRSAKMSAFVCVGLRLI